MTAPAPEPAPMPTETAQWQAIVDRDADADGRFVYGVATTGVYCRPSCSSRRPLRRNVRFFPTPAEAEAAGFRACKRCRPATGADPALARLDAVARYIEARVDESLPLAALAAEAGMSAGHFQRRFKARFGLSPKAYQDGLRLGRLKRSLKAGDPVLEAIVGAGFSSTSRVYGEPARHLGMTPSAYRAGGAGEVIAYACRSTVLGLVMMAATDRGVCFAEFGDSEAELLRKLGGEFPRATLVPSGASAAPALDAWIRAFDAHLAGGERPDLPLDLRGTAFQIRVWRFLLGVREGDVLSYTELAAGIDAPSAVRAAASACGANRIAVLIPCHRVLRGDGGLGGYRWGIERKRALIAAERAAGRPAPGK